MGKINLLDLDLAQYNYLITNIGQKKFRSKQLIDWIYKKRIFDFTQMSNLPKDFREVLNKKAKIFLPKLLIKQVSTLDGTTKYLFELEDNEKIETVYMPHKSGQNIKRNTLCVSTQIGCPVGCSFCATGQEGFTRNLEVGEIIGQLLAVEKEEKIKIKNVVFMGMGEPLLNYENVIKAIKIFIEKELFDLSARKITLSTSGIVPRIKDLAHENIPLVLAISLHTPWNKDRNKIVPINKKYPIEEIIAASKYYIAQTNRKVTFEYTLLKGINDSVQDAKKLGELLRDVLCNINIIPVNSVKETGLVRPSNKDIEIFRSLLQKYGLHSVVRGEKGADIDAACGQLRGKVREVKP